ncbi:MAG: hypothetical protein E7096_07115 [Bacteroides sp.]|nr:hypothetical protein [Bacteroides sp.]
MRNLMLFVLFLFPWGLYAQTDVEMRNAIEAYDYETPISCIAPACGDSVLTPLRAKALRAMNRYAEALKEWNSLLKADSTDVKTLIELGDCYRLVNRSDQAAICYEKSVAIRPENTFFRQQYIRTLLAIEDYKKARDASHAWLAEDTLSATGYKYLGMAYEGIAMSDPNELTNAFLAYNVSYRLDSLDGQTVAHIAAIFNNNNQFADAVDVTETYRLSDTLRVDVNRQNAKAYCMLKDYKMAVKRYEALKAMGDRSFTTLYYLGISHYGDNWVYGAQENLLEAHKKNPNDVNVLYYLAKASSRSSWKKEGVEYMEKAMELVVPTDSMMVRLYDGLAECYKSNGDLDEHIKALQQLYKLNKDYYIFYQIAQVYEWRRDDANAIYFYEKFMKLVPEDKRLILDEDGKPIEGALTRYQHAARQVEKMKSEDFFKNGK